MLYIYVKHKLTQHKRKISENIKKLATASVVAAGWGWDRSGWVGGWVSGASHLYWYNYTHAMVPDTRLMVPDAASQRHNALTLSAAAWSLQELRMIINRRWCGISATVWHICQGVNCNPVDPPLKSAAGGVKNI